MWERLDSKVVTDFDGFCTEYTMYCDEEEGMIVCVLGDSDWYGPEDESNWDFVTDNVIEAWEWFHDYSTED